MEPPVAVAAVEAPADEEHPEDAADSATAVDEEDRAADSAGAVVVVSAAVAAAADSREEAAVAEAASVAVDVVVTRRCSQSRLLSVPRAAGGLQEILKMKGFYRYHDLFPALMGLDGVYIVNFLFMRFSWLATWTVINLLKIEFTQTHFTAYSIGMVVLNLTVQSCIERYNSTGRYFAPFRSKTVS